MSELRQDPVTLDWVIVAPERAARPRGRAARESACPFCPGNARCSRPKRSEPRKSRGLPTYSMPRDALLAALLRQYFFVTIFRACAESIASENMARLVAMQAAEKSLGERRSELSGRLRSVRQDQITAELLDVVAGYEATRTDTRIGESAG